MKQEIEQMIGKKVIFPKDLVPKLLGEDISEPGLYISKKYKLVTYTQPLLCYDCSLETLEIWKTIIENIKNEDINLDFIFIFDHNNEEELTQSLILYDFKYPVYYNQSSFIRNNKYISKNQICHTFLINPNDTIIGVGSPLFNHNILDYYCKLVKNNTVANNATKEKI